jgi:LemA protein
VDSFPTNVIANMFSYKKRELFGLEEAAAKEPVKVKFEDK